MSQKANPVPRAPFTAVHPDSGGTIGAAALPSPGSFITKKDEQTRTPKAH